MNKIGASVGTQRVGTEGSRINFKKKTTNKHKIAFYGCCFTIKNPLNKSGKFRMILSIHESKNRLSENIYEFICLSTAVCRIIIN
jgi:hypothetical protein